MDILYLLIPLSVVLVFLIGAGFWWSLKNGQFDDLEGPAYRILMDDDRPHQPEVLEKPLSITGSDRPAADVETVADHNQSI